MNTTAFNAHAVDSLLKAHRTDAERMPAPAVSRYTREQIIASIKRWQERYGEPPKVFDWDPSWARRRGETWRAERFEAGDWPTVAIVRRQFGNMSKALFAAGVRPRRGPTRARSHVLSDDEILTAIREWARLYKEPPAIADWSPARARSGGQLWRLDRYYAGNWPSTNTVVRRFGTFSEAVRQAGLEPRPRGRHTGAAPSIPVDAREIIRRQLDSNSLQLSTRGAGRARPERRRGEERRRPDRAARRPDRPRGRRPLVGRRRHPVSGAPTPRRRLTELTAPHATRRGSARRPAWPGPAPAGRRASRRPRRCAVVRAEDVAELQAVHRRPAAWPRRLPRRSPRAAARAAARRRSASATVRVTAS